MLDQRSMQALSVIVDARLSLPLADLWSSHEVRQRVAHELSGRVEVGPAEVAVGDESLAPVKGRQAKGRRCLTEMATPTVFGHRLTRTAGFDEVRHTSSSW